MTPPLLTPQDVATFLGVKTKTIHQYVRDKRLTCIQISPRKRRFTPEQVEQFILSRTISEPKSVDTKISYPITYPQKGGDEKKSFGEKAKAQIREEMRLWQ
jgi:excisionase family DNA binding protein